MRLPDGSNVATRQAVHGSAPCARTEVLALFAVGDMYVSLCKKKRLRSHLARGEGRERYFGCNLTQRKVLALSHRHFNGGSTRNSTQNSRSALGTVTNTNSKLLIYGLFQEGRVLAQDGVDFLRSTGYPASSEYPARCFSL